MAYEHVNVNGQEWAVDIINIGGTNAYTQLMKMLKGADGSLDPLDVGFNQLFNLAGGSADRGIYAAGILDRTPARVHSNDGQSHPLIIGPNGGLTIYDSGFTCIGEGKISVTSGTALPPPTIPADTTHAVIINEGNPLRYYARGASKIPTSSDGLPLQDGQVLPWMGDPAPLRFIAVSATSDLWFMFFNQG